jgi:glutathione S-transferase
VFQFGHLPVTYIVCSLCVKDDEGFILYESRAIARYIEKKYASQGTPLIPTELKANALFEQAASIETSYYYPYARGAAHEALFKK